MTWYIQPHNKHSNDVIANLKRTSGRLVEDFHAEKKDSRGKRIEDLWEVTLRELRAMMDEKDHLDLKFVIYKSVQNSDYIALWERPRRKKRDLKIVLPLMAMNGSYETVFSKTLRQSRKYSSANVSYCPTWIVLSLMKRDRDDKEQVIRGFETIYTQLLSGGYHEIMVLDDEITSGMEKIIVFAYMLGIPIKAKTRLGKTVLERLM